MNSTPTMDETGENPKYRPIRSFVLREGRMTEAQARAFEELWPRYGIDFPEGETLDLAAIFGNDHPVLLEIGFGNGDALLHAASTHPENNYIGIEVHRPGVGRLLNLADKRALTNLRVMRHDAMEVLRHALPECSLQRVSLFFPDPWHKKKHHKRRIVQPEFAQLTARALSPNGILHMATDWEDYARHMMDVLSASEDFVNCAGAGRYSPRPEDRPLTRFEQRGQRLGHGVWDLLFLRR